MHLCVSTYQWRFICARENQPLQKYTYFCYSHNMNVQSKSAPSAGEVPCFITSH